MKDKKTIASKLIESIVAVFKELFPSFIDKTYRKIEPELRQEISWITQIVSKINVVLESPGIDVLTALIPGDADDQFVDWARKVLPMWIKAFGRHPSNEDKAILSAKLVQDKIGMELSQALITSQVVYKKENG